MNSAVIVDSVRTGITKSFKGKLRHTNPVNLAAQCVNALLQRNQSALAEDASVDDCVIGCAFPEGAQGMNIGRNIAVLSGLSTDVSGMTVNRYCASGLQAVANAANQILCGNADTIVAGGVESVSTTLKTVNTRLLYNPDIKERVPGMYLGMNTEDAELAFHKNAFGSMGLTAEIIAEKYQISREAQDEYAFQSQMKMAAAQRDGKFDDEIIDVEFQSRRKWEQGERLSRDECNRPSTTLDRLAELKPSFKEDGTVTAGNSSQVTDGAAMCLLMSEYHANQVGADKLGYFHGYVTSGCAPEEMGLGPIKAVRKLLDRFSLSTSDIDLYELNEAFASSTLYCQQVLEIDADKLNVNGGAISMGHPFGMTGARQVGHIVRELRRRNKKYGVVTLCVGGGMGVASLIEAC